MRKMWFPVFVFLGVAYALGLLGNHVTRFLLTDAAGGSGVWPQLHAWSLLFVAGP